jgi:hypothetical protein
MTLYQNVKICFQSFVLFVCLGIFLMVLDIHAENTPKGPPWTDPSLLGELNGPVWTEPFWFEELNDGDNNAGAACLTENLLTILFDRYDPDLGYYVLVEGTRETPYGHFTSQRVLTELCTTIYGIKEAWISPDGLRLYYKIKRETVPGLIAMSQRDSVSGPWTFVKTLDELTIDGYPANGISLTEDEQTIVFHSARTGSIYGENANLWIATRPSVDEPFDNIQPLDEINSYAKDMGPYIKPDGLTIYFRSEATGNLDIYKATRSSTDLPFGNLQKHPLSTIEYNEGIAYVTQDEKEIYWSTDKYDIGGHCCSYLEDSIQGEKAGAPCLTADQMTIVFGRYFPELGHAAIVEATRETPDGPFTSERVLTELCTTGYDLKGPWISPDSLRLYYKMKRDIGPGLTAMAERESVLDSWTFVKTFDELNIDEYPANGISLTEDELTIVFHSARPGSIYGINSNLWIARRPSVDEAFSNIMPLDEINTEEDEQTPHILSDGLTIYYRSSVAGSADIYKAVRSSTDLLFGDIQSHPINTGEYYEGGPYVSPNERELYFASDRDEIWGIWYTRSFKIFCPN